MEPRHISAVNNHPIDLRAAHPNVLEHVVIERMKLAYRRDACASDGMGAPPFAGTSRIGILPARYFCSKTSSNPSRPKAASQRRRRLPKPQSRSIASRESWMDGSKAKTLLLATG